MHRSCIHFIDTDVSFYRLVSLVEIALPLASPETGSETRSFGIGRDCGLDGWLAGREDK